MRSLDLGQILRVWPFAGTTLPVSRQPLVRSDSVNRDRVNEDAFGLEHVGTAEANLTPRPGRSGQCLVVEVTHPLRMNIPPLCNERYRIECIRIKTFDAFVS